METLIKAYLDDYGKVTVYVSSIYYQGKCDSFYLMNDEGYCSPCVIRGVNNLPDGVRYDLTVTTDHDLTNVYYIMENHGRRCEVEYRFVVKSPAFDEQFTYTGKDLGATYHPDHTDFAVWAPTAHGVSLEVEDAKQSITVKMERTEKGVWRASLKGNFADATYVYYVRVNGKVLRTLDPYGFSCTANGHRSAILDPRRLLHLESHFPRMKSTTEAIVYECNVRDFTADPNTGTKTNSKFLSLTEEGTTYMGKATGLDYLAELGITHVQFMPIFDYATVDENHAELNYNWGYDPLNYLCPEGSYSSNPNDPYTRVLELQQMILALHQKGLRVNIDLVLNHHYDVALSALDRTVPYYYFRFNDQGYYSNGSFCGNDIDSTKAMCRKYLIDNIDLWLKLYDVDGFRFDLMGVLDVETMNQMIALGHSIKPDCMFYGEGWNLPTALPQEQKAIMENAWQLPEMSFFNNFFRDIVKGGSSEGDSWRQGYATGDARRITEMIACMTGGLDDFRSIRWFKEPTQSVNYVECHDNQTAWDKMKDCCKDDIREIRKAKQKIMIGCTILAEGIPFLHSGEEFCRTKFGSHNSFNIAGKTNEIDWDRRNTYQDVLDFTKACIALRKKNPVFRLTDYETILKEVYFTCGPNDALQIHYHHKDVETMVIVNPVSVETSVQFDKELTCCLDSANVLTNKKAKSVQIAPYSLAVFEG